MLPPKQQRFVEEYLVDLNATQAAIRAGYSAHTAAKIASQLLDKTRVVEALQAARDRLAKKTEWTQERAVANLIPIAESDIGEIMDFTSSQVRMRPANEIPVHARRCISSMKVKRYVEGRGEDAQTVEVVEFKLWDKHTALDQLARIIGYYKPMKVDLTADEAAAEIAKWLGIAPEQLPTAAPEEGTTVH